MVDSAAVHLVANDVRFDSIIVYNRKYPGKLPVSK